MMRPKCELCDRPAVVHETLAGVVPPLTRHYCREHGLPVWRDALPAVEGPVRTEFRNRLGGYPGRSPRERG